MNPIYDPWRGLYDPAATFNVYPDRGRYHPDLPDCDDESIPDGGVPPVRAQGFDAMYRDIGGAFIDRLMVSGGPEYFSALINMDPPPPPGWRLAGVFAGKLGPVAMFVRPLALAIEELEQESDTAQSPEWRAYTNAETPLPVQLGPLMKISRDAYRANKIANYTVSRLDGYRSLTPEMRKDRSSALDDASAATKVLNRVMRYPN